MPHIFADNWVEMAASGTWAAIWLVLGVLALVGGWKMLVKAGKPGWGIIIPVYNIYLFCRVAGRPGWWLILFFIPIVNIVIGLIVALNIAENFGHGAGYGILLWLFPWLMYLVLGFGTDTYRNVRT